MQVQYVRLRCTLTRTVRFTLLPAEIRLTLDFKPGQQVDLVEAAAAFPRSALGKPDTLSVSYTGRS